MKDYNFILNRFTKNNIYANRYRMKKILDKFINQCGCIDIKIVVLLFFLFAFLFTTYYKTDEDCDCN